MTSQTRYKRTAVTKGTVDWAIHALDTAVQAVAYELVHQRRRLFTGDRLERGHHGATRLDKVGRRDHLQAQALRLRVLDRHLLELAVRDQQRTAAVMAANN